MAKPSISKPVFLNDCKEDNMNRKLIIMIKVLMIAILLASISTPLAQAAGPDGGDGEESKPLPSWRQVNTSGFGDPENIGIVLEGFKGYLYAGTSNWNIGGSVWRSADGFTWDSVFTTTIPAVIDMIKFKNPLYVGVGLGGGPPQVWRTPDGTTWEQVVGDGFGDPTNVGITAFIMYKNMLYAATSNNNGVQIWRSPTGDLSSWTNVVTDGFGYTTNIGVTGFVKFKGALYAAIRSEAGVGPAQVWRSTDGLNWTEVTTDGFGDANNFGTGGFAAFKNYLYLGTDNNNGGQLWRSKKGLTWTKVGGDGFGDLNNITFGSLILYKASLYTVTSNHVTGMEVWRTKNANNWQQVNTDGFGDSNNKYPLWSVGTTIYKARLFIGAWNDVDGGEIWEMLPGKP